MQATPLATQNPPNSGIEHQARGAAARGVAIRRRREVPSRAERVIGASKSWRIIQSALEGFAPPERAVGGSLSPKMSRDDARTLCELSRAVDIQQERIRILLREGTPRVEDRPKAKAKPRQHGPAIAPWRPGPDSQLPPPPSTDSMVVAGVRS